MFGCTAQKAVKKLGAEGDLIYNSNRNHKIDMLTLVKVKKETLWPIIKYQFTDETLLGLLEMDYTPEYKEELLIKDIRELAARSGNGAITIDTPVNHISGIEVQAAGDTVDGTSAFTLKAQAVDTKVLRDSCTGKEVKRTTVDLLRLRREEKLTVVYKKVFNDGPVKFTYKDKKSGNMAAKFKEIFNLRMHMKNQREETFILPENSTFAYGLLEITINKGNLGVPLRITEVNHFTKGWWRRLSADGDGTSLPQVRAAIKGKARLLLPLARLPELSRHDLLKALGKVLDDSDAPTLLAQALEESGEGAYERLPCEAVASFMDLLDVSKASTKQKDAFCLLVSAMNYLPDGIPAMFVNSPEIVGVLNPMVSSLKTGAVVKLPECLPPALQEDGELHWLVKLLCLTEEILADLTEKWDIPELPAEVVLELLCLVVEGLSLMQPQTRS